METNSYHLHSYVALENLHTREVFIMFSNRFEVASLVGNGLRGDPCSVVGHIKKLRLFLSNTARCGIFKNIWSFNFKYLPFYETANLTSLPKTESKICSTNAT